MGYDGNISLYTNMSSEFCLIMSNVARLMSLYTEKINEGVNSSRVDSVTFEKYFRIILKYFTKALYCF